MNRNNYIRMVREMQIPTADIGQLSGIPPQRVSDYLNNRRLSVGVEARIEEAIMQIHTIQTQVYAARFDASQPERVRGAFTLLQRCAVSAQADALIDGLAKRLAIPQECTPEL